MLFDFIATIYLDTQNSPLSQSLMPYWPGTKKKTTP